MSNIYELVTLRLPGKKEKTTLRRIDILRALSDIAKNETDMEIQEFFNTFRI